MEQETEQTIEDAYFQLSTQALTGQFYPQTLKFKGLVGGLTVMVLMHMGSTHNIMQPWIANHLNLQATPTTKFFVMVGNGLHLQCEGICHNVQLVLQNKPFILPFYLLPIEGADVVLSMQWLRTLGPIQVVFSVPSITFQHQDIPITLKGDSSTHPTQSTFHQFHHLILTNSISSLHLMIIQQINNLPTSNNHVISLLHTLPSTIHPEIVNLLTTYQTIF